MKNMNCILLDRIEEQSLALLSLNICNFPVKKRGMIVEDSLSYHDRTLSCLGHHNVSLEQQQLHLNQEMGPHH